MLDWRKIICGSEKLNLSTQNTHNTHNSTSTCNFADCTDIADMDLKSKNEEMKRYGDNLIYPI